MVDDPLVPNRHPNPARRLLVVVAVAVAALLLAPVSGVVPGSGTSGVAAPAPAPATASTGSAVEAVQVSATAERKAGKKLGKKAKRAALRAAKRRAALAAAEKRRRAEAAVVTAHAAWTTPTVSYYDGLPEQWDWSLRTAVEQWNATGVDLTLVPVSDPAKAQVRIGYGAIQGNSGLATLGRTSGAFVKLSDRYRSAIGDEYDRVEVMGVLTHELGHVLGLEHTAQRCGLMGTVMDIVGCGIFDVDQPDVYRCDVVGTAAALEAVRLYGGVARAQSGGSCAVGAPAA